ncbi:hypothetical protein ABIF86_004810 [Bradyrhizobium japonicum]
MTTEAEEGLSIAAAIANLRDELEKAIEAGKDKTLHFSAEEITLELSVGFTLSKDGKVGIKVWVVEAGGGIKRDDTGTHKVTLKLKIEGSNRISDAGAKRRKTSAEVAAESSK